MADAIENMIADTNRQTSKQSRLSNDVKFIVPKWFSTP